MIDRLKLTVTAKPRPPDWCRTDTSASFYLVAGNSDEYCLPCRPGRRDKPYDVLTCMHRASETDIFRLTGRDLAMRCAFDKNRLPPGDARRSIIQKAVNHSGRLSWDRPSWAAYDSDATWWIIDGGKLAMPIRWKPGAKGDRELIILDLATA